MTAEADDILVVNVLARSSKVQAGLGNVHDVVGAFVGAMLLEMLGDVGAKAELDEVLRHQTIRIKAFMYKVSIQSIVEETSAYH